MYPSPPSYIYNQGIEFAPESSSGVTNVGSSSLSIDRDFSLISCIPLYSFIFERTTKGSKGIRLVFRNTALQSVGVKVFVENLLKIEKKSALVISFAL